MDAQPFYPVLQGGPFHTEPSRCASCPGQHPVGLFQRIQNMGALDIRHRDEARSVSRFLLRAQAVEFGGSQDGPLA
ncbi:MAG: hypothetical protein U0361_07390 [Nitrospiraceae bacterium]